jgi:hypothetical protein
MEMNVTWGRVLAGSAVVVFLLGMSVLEVVGHRIRGDAFSTTGSNPGDERMRPWHDSLVTQGPPLNLELGQPADWDATGPAVTQDRKNLTEVTQTGRMTVLKVNKEARQIVALNHVGRVRVAELSNKAVVITEDKKAADLALLNAGDLIQVEPRDGQVQRILVLRRAWQETASPEQ